MLTYEQSYEQLKLRIKDLADKVLEPNLPFTIKGASNQKLTQQYIQLWIKQWDKIGRYELVDYNTTAVKYEVMIEIAVHRPPSSTSLTGSTTIQLAKILHGLTAHAGSYLDSFTDGDISFLRCGVIDQRHWPIDKNQLEERSSVDCIFEVVVVNEDNTDVGYIETVNLSAIRTKTAPNVIAVEDTLTVSYDGSYVTNTYVQSGYITQSPINNPTS